MDKSLLQWSFEFSKFDERIYFFRQGDEFVILVIAVDDLAFASNSTKLMNHVKKRLAANFDVKLFGQLTSFLGWSVSRSEKGIKTNQSGSVRQILKDHGIQSASAVKTPLQKTTDVLPAHRNEN